MAMDWIKMRCNLWDDPRVGGLVEATDTNEATVIGGLYWLWSTADQHTADGAMPNVSLKHIDRKTGIPGFGAALVAIGWVIVGDAGGLSVARFDEHNGSSGKQRAMTAKRVAAHRATHVTTKSNGSGVTETEHDRELEQEQEEEEDLEAKATVQQAAQGEPPKDELPADIPRPDGPGSDDPPLPRAAPAKRQTAARFPEFWATYPVKKGKADALKKWKSKGCDAIADQIIAHVRLMEREDDQWKRGYIPHGSTYINGELWTDEPVKDRDTVHVTTAAPAPETFGAAAVAARNNTESPLQRAVAHIRHQHMLGAFGEGDAADAERDRLIADAKQRLGGSNGK